MALSPSRRERVLWGPTLGLALAALVSAPARGQAPAAQTAPRFLDILELRVTGSRLLSEAELEAVISRFLGPHRELEDVERARAAVEKAYSDRGYLAVTVAIPQQRVREGVVTLEVKEGTVGRLRVRGARWFSLGEIKALAPSVAEGETPNLNALSRDLVALNQLPDRRVTPELRAGVVPGTVDVDLKVQDTFPLHGLLEFNNRSSANTSPTRLTGSLEYDNLWQLGHALKFSFQLAPQQLPDARVFSVAYTLRFPSMPWLSVVLSGISQDSAVSTLGGVAVAGRGWLASGRVLVVLPALDQFYQTLSLGLDFKRFIEKLALGQDSLSSFLTYWPLSVQYGATLLGETWQTQLGVTLTFNIRGLGSNDVDFDVKRYGATASFLHVRADLSRLDRLPLGFELALKANGQYSPAPLVGSEQLIGGGAESVRGYLEAQAAGDWGGFVSAELRGPSLAAWLDPGSRVLDEWRLFVFGEGGWVRLWNPLPEQQSIFRIWSTGAGTRARLLHVLNGAVELTVPLRSEGATARLVPRVLFRVWLEF